MFTVSVETSGVSPSRAEGATIEATSATVDEMNKAAAWSVRGVGRETREIAEEAARRAGMSLGDWLDEVVAEQAADWPGFAEYEVSAAPRQIPVVLLDPVA